MQVRALRDKLLTDWKTTIFYLALLAGAGWLLVFRLSNLVPGFSPAEASVLRASQHLDLLKAQPVDAPYLLLVHVLSFIKADSMLWGRAVSVACGLLALALFCGLAWHWHGKRTALIGTVLFATSAWFLHTARWGTPDALLFLLLALVACYVWLERTRSGWALLATFITVACLLYVPGMVWFIAIGVIWRWRSVDQAFTKNLWAMTSGGVLLLAALTPIGYALYHQPSVGRELLGLPAAGWPQPLHVLHDMALIPLHLFIGGSIDAERWLGTVAIVDVFSAAMFVLGCYLYVRHIGLKRVQLCFGILILGVVLASLGGAVSITIILPFIYMIIAAGIGFMLDRWLEVFPRNTLAKGAGYILLTLAVISACSYSLTQYFVAWPQAKATRMRYTEHHIPSSSATIKE